MLILGIDPGLATIGIGIVERGEREAVKAIDWMTIQTPKGLPIGERLVELQKDLMAIVDDVKPDLAVVEKLFFKKNITTAIDVAHARGVILAALTERGVPILEPTPMELKMSITGSGAADKSGIQQMLMMELKLKEIPKPDDAADALALALFGAHQAGRLSALASSR